MLSENTSPMKSFRLLSERNTLQELKKQTQMKMMIELSKTTKIPQIKKMNEPSKSFLQRDFKSDQDLEIISLLSTSAEDSEESTLEEKEDLIVPKKNKSSGAVETNKYYLKKRLKKFSERFGKFEEILIHENVVNKDAIQKLKHLNTRFLEICFDPDLKCQQMESICLSILLTSCDEIGLSKKNFVKMAKKVFKKGAVKISRIRKSRCYASVKKMKISVNDM